MGIMWSWLGLSLGFCSKVDEKKKISRQIDKEILQELKQEAGLMKDLKQLPFVINFMILHAINFLNVPNGLVR